MSLHMSFSKKQTNEFVHKIGAIASLGGMICGNAVIPKTRSGKTLRRVLRELIENGTKGIFEDVVVNSLLDTVIMCLSANHVLV